MNKKTAFTLAEVLITIGIIGIVAAMTLPAIIHKKQSVELETGFKKGYSVLQQVIARMTADEGQIINYDNYPDRKFYDIFKKYLSLYVDCGFDGCVSADITPEDGGMNLVSKYKTYNKSRYTTLEMFDEGQAITTDGMLFLVQNSSARESKIMISIDINGMNKGPNIMGHDLFTFQIQHNGKLLPMGTPGTTALFSMPCDKTSNSQFNGAGCAYRAFAEKDYFKNLP